MTKPTPYRPPPSRRTLPRSFKDLTPAKHFNPRTFFREMVWKALLTRRTGQQRQPAFPKLAFGQVAVTWIGHASFLVQFTDLNVNWTRNEACPIQVTATWPKASFGKAGCRCCPVRRVSKAFQTISRKKVRGLKCLAGVKSLKERGS